jgi:hypothetical protein
VIDEEEHAVIRREQVVTGGGGDIGEIDGGHFFISFELVPAECRANDLVQIFLFMGA